MHKSKGGRGGLINIWLASWALPDESENMVARLVWNGILSLF